MKSIEVTSAETLFPGAVTFRVANIPQTPEEWANELPELTRSYLGVTGLNFMHIAGRAGARTSIRTLETPTHPWENDLFPHKDLTPTGSLIGTVVTGIVCVETSGSVPGLRLIDTVALFEDIKAIGIFEKYGVSTHDLTHYQTQLSYESFFSRTLGKRVANTQGKNDEDILIALRSKMKLPPEDGQYSDIVTMPLVETNPFSGASGLCIEAERFIGIQHVETGEQLPDELIDELFAIVEDTTDPAIVHNVDYEAGKALLFARDGTVHNGLYGECHRIIHIGRIATNPKAHEMAMAAMSAEIIGKHSI